MRNSLKKFGAAVGGLVLSGVAAAQSTPTTALALAQTVDPSDAKAAGLVVVGLMIVVGVVLWGARLVLSKFKPKI